MKASFLIILLFLLSGFSQAQNYKIKPESVKITFEADMHKVSGSIGGFEAVINFNKDNLSKSSIKGSVKVKTIDTGIKKRDEHLNSKDFFESDKFPLMTFESTSFKKEADKYVMTGKLKIKDVEREESITFSFVNNEFKGELAIQASNYKFGFEDKKPGKTNVIITFFIPVLK